MYRRPIPVAVAARLFDRNLIALPAMSPAETDRLLSELAALGPVVRVRGRRRRVVCAADRGRLIELRNRLACGHLGICLRCAARRAGRLDPADLAQVGFLRLLRVAEVFDPGCGAIFTVYACQQVRVVVDRAIARRAGLIRLPVRAVEGTRPLPPAEVDRLTRRARLGPRGAAGSAPVAPERVPEFEAAEAAGRREWVVAGVLASLPDRDAEILRARFGIGTPEQTLEAIGARLGLTRERVRQIEGRALERLRYGPRRVRLEAVAPT
ncbi:MAG: sigma-70 family RNA polymerase sigma factor [Gemmataceae bacterium]|nr:sigma-70 family RNA polymerase sigma factor [Gemmataceae bacterium]